MALRTALLKSLSFVVEFLGAVQGRLYDIVKSSSSKQTKGILSFQILQVQ
jgi:hypothetical protein